MVRSGFGVRHKRNATSAIVQCRSTILKEEERRYSGENGNRAGEMDCRVSLLGKRESEAVIRMCGVCDIREKASEARLRYFGNVKRRDEEEPVKKEMMLPVRGRRSVLRQRIRWRGLVKRGMHELGLQEEEAMDRCKWRTITLADDLTTHWE